MLDTDTPAQGDDGTQDTSAPAAPQRRRRSASRPAGPPAAIEASSLNAELPAAPVLPALTNAEPEFVEAEVIEAPQPVAEAQPEPAADKPKRAPRKRASRPAGPPVEPPVSSDPAPEVPEASEAPASRRRRRATTAAGAPSAAVESPVPVIDEPAPAEPGTDDPADAPADQTTDEPAAGDVAASLAELEKSRPRRRSARRPVAEPTTDGTGDVASALDSLAAAIGARVADDAELDEDGEPDEAEETQEATAEAETDASEAVPADGLDDDADEDPDDEAGDGTARRRRRRRGGRRRRRGAGDRADDADETSEDDESASDDETSEDADAEPAGEAAEAPSETSNSRRRRRRRRRGEEGAEDTSEDGVDIVVKVREPRKPRTASDEITGIEGSTRMEAKKQRRREGRAAGRRRAPILSEAEFLARRESVERKMVIRQREEYTQIGVLEDGVLVEHYVDRDSSASMIGNIYLGRVQNVLASMEAAFVDIGRGRNAVLYAGEVDWEGFGATGADRKVEKVLKSGQAVLVQVTKDPVGAKGARLTSHISIPGRYVVYSPGGQLSGISRKLPENERARLKGILDELVGENASVIVRTAAEGASEEELVRDVNRLKAQWEVIEKKVAQGNSPQMLYSEPDLTVRIVRDLFTEDFSELIVDGNGQGEDAYDTVQAYVTHVAPHLQERLVKWNRWTQGDLFGEFRVDEQVSKALERKVHLPSGGSLIIDRTEAMTVVDVNTGKFTGTQGNLEATVTSNNLEAAEEIVRQLRLRDIGGIIVIDFIDMVLPANRELLLRRLVECLGRDRTRHQVAEVTSLGLVQMTRKKIGTGLAEAFTVPCETCKGRGYHIHDAPVASQAPADGGDRDTHHGNSRRHRGGHSGQQPPASQG